MGGGLEIGEGVKTFVVDPTPEQGDLASPAEGASALLWCWCSENLFEFQRPTREGCLVTPDCGRSLAFPCYGTGGSDWIMAIGEAGLLVCQTVSTAC